MLSKLPGGAEFLSKFTGRLPCRQTGAADGMGCPSPHSSNFPGLFSLVVGTPFLSSGVCPCCLTWSFWIYHDMKRGKNFREMIQMSDPCLILRDQLLQRADGHRQPPLLTEIFSPTSKV